MTGSQAPLWITVVLGVLVPVSALAGSIGGQWIAARNGDKRWERDAQREELRWQRELERERNQREHDLEVLRRQDIIRSVSRYVGCLRTWHSVIWSIYPDIPEGGRPTGDHADRFRQVEQDAADALGLLELVCPGELQEAARDAWFEYSSAETYMAAPHEQAFKQLGSLGDELDWVLLIARKELGFDGYRPQSVTLSDTNKAHFGVSA